jgi:DNA polymerase-1
MLLLIDGNNIGYRAFHTPQGQLETKDGKPTGVMQGVLKSIKLYLERFPETTKCLVCFDGGKAEWRKELYPEYKANRSYGDDPEEKERFEGLFNQLNELNEMLPKINVRSIKLDGHEADDLIYAFCELTQDNVMIVSSDKDMLQLINERVSVYTPYKDRVIGISDFYDETGVTMKAYLGYRALVGDKSDNIIGVHGIGEKKAKALMDKYGHIDHILGATGDVKKALMKSKVNARIFEPENLQRLGINNKIMNLKFFDYTGIRNDLDKALNDPIEFDSNYFKNWLMRNQFAAILAEYLAFSMVFRALEEDDE